MEDNNMTLQEYLVSLQHKTVAVIGIGVSNTPLLRLLLASAGTAVPRSTLAAAVGGGGNTATAGAQMKNTTVKDALDRLVESIDKYYEG